jgi:hypothetical protein
MGVGILFLGHRTNPLPITWIEIAAALGVLVTIYVGLWARRKGKLSLGLVLILVGNMLCCSAVLLPFGIESKPKVLTAGASLYVLSILVRFIKLIKLVSNKAV